jgi:hypothetical protein
MTWKRHLNIDNIRWRPSWQLLRLFFSEYPRMIDSSNGRLVSWDVSSLWFLFILTFHLTDLWRFYEEIPKSSKHWAFIHQSVQRESQAFSWVRLCLCAILQRWWVWEIIWVQRFRFRLVIVILFFRFSSSASNLHFNNAWNQEDTSYLGRNEDKTAFGFLTGNSCFFPSQILSLILIIL